MRYNFNHEHHIVYFIDMPFMEDISDPPEVYVLLYFILFFISSCYGQDKNLQENNL
jgi:hypothetical protein